MLMMFIAAAIWCNNLLSNSLWMNECRKSCASPGRGIKATKRFNTAVFSWLSLHGFAWERLRLKKGWTSLGSPAATTMRTRPQCSKCWPVTQKNNIHEVARCFLWHEANCIWFQHIKTYIGRPDGPGERFEPRVSLQVKMWIFDTADGMSRYLHLVWKKSHGSGLATGAVITSCGFQGKAVAAVLVLLNGFNSMGKVQCSSAAVQCSHLVLLM